MDEGKITSVLSSLSSMTAERVIEGDEIDSMADFGLETPSQEVVVTAGDEKTTIMSEIRTARADTIFI